MKQLSILFAALLLLTSCSLKQNAVGNDAGSMPLSRLDIESFIDTIDTQMNISELSLSDLRILRNAFAARKGYPFRDAYLRSVYSTTTWYDSLMWAFDANGDYFEQVENNDTLSWRDLYYQSIRTSALGYTPEQLEFIDRIKEREDALRQLNFKTAKDERVNMANLANPAQMSTFPGELYARLARNGFAIVPASHLQLFHVYEENDYHEFPSFVTTDLYLQLYHLYFDALLREVEEKQFYHQLGQFCHEAQKLFPIRPYGEEWLDTLPAVTWLNTYFNVAMALLTEQPPRQDKVALSEYERVMKGENSLSDYLDYTDVPFEYSMFRPRGHYTRSETLKRYFRAMMWLQTVPFRADSPFDMFKASLLANEVYYNKKLNALYKQLTEPLDWLMGQPDDVSILQLGTLIAEMETDDIDPNELCDKVNALAERQTRLRPKFQRTGRNKVRLMPQRYQPDAEVLQEMVDYDSEQSRRATPRGLDVFAAMGCAAAEQILIDELDEANRWKQYRPNLERMKQRMDSIDWQQNVSTKWMDALTTVTQTPDAAPYFMLTPEWDRKELNTALASWAELKHDAILYAKQPMGAECGAGGPPDPVVKGYVEPNVGFWRKALLLLQQTDSLFKAYGLHTERTISITDQMAEHLQFFLYVSEKELEGKEISDVEYDQIEYLGAAFENMSLDMLRDPDHQLWEWDDVQGPERSVALIADVYTANADNNPRKSILYEGIGPADELYVVVEIGGYLYLMRGAVFSYRELTRPYGEQRMNDEEWQKSLENNPRQGVPQWMEPVVVPLKETPVDNEEVFYSSGC